MNTENTIRRLVEDVTATKPYRDGFHYTTQFADASAAWLAAELSRTAEALSENTVHADVANYRAGLVAGYAAHLAATITKPGS